MTAVEHLNPPVTIGLDHSRDTQLAKKRVIPRSQILHVNKVKFLQRIKEKPIFWRQLIRLEHQLLEAKTTPLNIRRQYLYISEINRLLLKEEVAVNKKEWNDLSCSQSNVKPNKLK